MTAGSGSGREISVSTLSQPAGHSPGAARKGFNGSDYDAERAENCTTAHRPWPSRVARSV